MTATDTTWVALEAFGELTAIGRAGGQGRVHRPSAAPEELGPEPLVVKLYRRRPEPAAGQALAEMVRWERSLPAASRGRLAAAAAWPIAVVVARRRTVGIVMRDVTAGYGVPFLMPSGRRDTVLLALEHLLGPDAFLRNRGLAVELDTRTRALVAEQISSRLAFLHQHGVAVGDVAPSNVLVSFRATDVVQVCFIDCDSMIFRGMRALAAVETGDWDLPGDWAEPRGTRAADAYKLGLVVLRLFARSHDARTVAPHLHHLPVAIRDLLDRALSPDAVNRPPAGEWQRALRAVRSGAVLNASHPGPDLGSAPLPIVPRPVAIGAAARAPTATASVAGRRATRLSLRRVVIVLWIVALALVAGVLIARLEHSGAGATTTTYYPDGPGGRVLPSVGRVGPGSGRAPQ